MQSTPRAAIDQLAERLLQHLRDEAALLQTACGAQAELHALLRRGALSAVAGLQAQYETLAARIQRQQSAREQAARDLAKALGQADKCIVLAELAAALPVAPQAQLLNARTELRTLANELAEIRKSNASLIHYLRSYFQGILSGLTPGDAPPVRYGRSGARVGAAQGGVVQARG